MIEQGITQLPYQVMVLIASALAFLVAGFIF
jgi:hypothetical protein